MTSPCLTSVMWLGLRAELALARFADAHLAALLMR